MPNKITRHVVPAPVNTLCGFDYYGRKCGGDAGKPAPAVHTLTHSLPAGPAGRHLCAYHSPYDVVRRWELTLSPDGSTDKRDSVHTFTWGVTRMDAYGRVTDMMDAVDGMWDGWSFTLANEPTANLYG